jgi:hypothetical protein
MRFTKVIPDFHGLERLRCIICSNCSLQMVSQMFLASCRDVRRCRNWRAMLVLVAICSLSVSLATRYTRLNSESGSVKIVKSQSPDVKKQHLVRDALKWTAPTPKFTLVPAVRSHVHVVSAVFLATNLSSESWLYNRPPPSC